MLNYKLYKIQSKEVRGRVIDKLLSLKKDLSEKIPAKTLNQTLLLASWNIRDFDSNKFGHGPRLAESFRYIAQIISAFDIVAIQEVNEDLDALKKVLNILGRNWEYIVTDATEGTSGNKERMCFVYDSRKVRFTNEAGEIVLSKANQIQNAQQFARTPFKVSFQSGWFKFSLCTVHLYYGADRGEKLKRRIDEIRKISSAIAKKAKQEESNIILLGDFNIISPEHETMKALRRRSFIIPPALQKETNMLKNKFYDQIAFMQRKNELQLGPSKPNAGVYDPFEVVFKSDEFMTYYKLVKDKSQWNKLTKKRNTKEKARKNYYNSKWRTFQISDHLPLWVELNIDFSEAYLSDLTKLEKDAILS